MGKFVCTRSMAVDGSFIWCGTYNFEKKGDYFVVKNAQGNNNVNLFMTKSEIDSCGYLTDQTKKSTVFIEKN